MEATIVNAVLEQIGQARIGLLGDFYLDIRWTLDVDEAADADAADATQKVRRQTYRLGGAGQVAHDLVAMGCTKLHVFGVMGNDPWGRELRRLLRGIGTDTTGLLRQAELFHTPAHLHPCTPDDEFDPILFGAYNRLTDDSAAALVAQLEAKLPDLDIVLIHQDLEPGIHNRFLRGRLTKLIDRHRDICFIVNPSSYRAQHLHPLAWILLDAHQALQLTDPELAAGRAPDVLIPRPDILRAAATLVQDRGRPVIINRGPRGIILDTGRLVADIPGIQVLGRTDSSGARPALFAAFGAALACGAKPSDAARFANLAAAVTLGKLGEPGIPSAADLRAAAVHPAYSYHPELAEDPRQARHHAGSEIEIVEDLPPDFRLTHAIFDHDGTITTLRQGWEAILQPMMVRAILGPAFQSADEGQYHQTLHQVRELIDDTTGMPVLIQMGRLQALVRDTGCVPAADILEPAGYRDIYTASLARVVAQRLGRLQARELAPEDFVIKNAIPLLQALHRAGVQLHLIAAADQADVEAEARALGIHSLFHAIHGARPDNTREFKGQILDRAVAAIRASGAPLTGTAIFGDGPAEIRAARRHGALPLGVATDEVRRFTLNPTKRSRLVRAGAALILPDYAQLAPLLSLLGLSSSQTPTVKRPD